MRATAYMLFCLLLLSVCQNNPHEPSLSTDGAGEVALHILHTEYHEPLLLPAIKLLYCLASSSPPPPAITAAFSSLHTGELMALTTSQSPYLSNASRALLALTSFGQRARGGESIGRQQLGEVEYARFELRMERMARAEGTAAAADGETTGSGSGQPSSGSSSGSGSSGQDVVKCGGCGKLQGNGASFSACGRCRSVRYCSKECQLRHWKEHKAHCNKR